MLKEKKDDIAQWNIIYFSFLHVKIFQGFENHFADYYKLKFFACQTVLYLTFFVDSGKELETNYVFWLK